MREVLIGQTDYSVLVRIAGTDGAPETGLTNASIDIAYARVETDNDVTTSDVTPASLSALTDAHSDWGFIEVSATDHPGLYRLDIADAVFASGAWEAVVTITDASGTDFYAVDIGFRLVSFNVQDGVRLGLTALPNAAADAAGGLPISDAGGLDLDARLDAAITSRLAPTTAGRTLDVTATNKVQGVVLVDTLTTYTGNTPQTADHTANISAILADTNELQTDWTNGGRLDLIVDAILDDTGTSGVVVAAASKSGYSLVSTGLDLVTAWSVAITGNITGNLSGSVGSVTGAVGSVTGNVGGNVVGSVGSVTGAVGSVTATVNANMTQISGDSTAADNLEAVLDGTGGVDLRAKSLWLTNTAGDALRAISSGGNGIGVSIAGHGTGQGMVIDGGNGASTDALLVRAISTTGHAAKLSATTETVWIESTASNGIEIEATAGIPLYLSGVGYGIQFNLTTPTALFGSTTTTIPMTTNQVADGWITALAIASNAIDADSLATDAVTEIQSGLATAAELAKVPKSDSNVTWNATALASIQSEANDALVANNLDHLVLSAVDTDFATTVHLNSVIGHLADNGTSATFDRTTDSLEVLAGASAPSAATIADAVWDELLSGHAISGSTGEALSAAGSAGDPWITTLPGSYTGTQAGKILSDILDDSEDIPGILAAIGASTVSHTPVISDSLIIVVEDDTYDGTLNQKIYWTTSTNYTGATIAFSVWRQNSDGSRETMLTQSGTVVSSVRVELATHTATFDETLEYSGLPAFEKLQFACVATLASKEYTVAIGDYVVKERR